MNNFTKYLEKVIYKGQCADCSSHFPNQRTTVVDKESLHNWKSRHIKSRGHQVRTAITFVRVYN